jgi:hypothetical protein
MAIEGKSPRSSKRARGNGDKDRARCGVVRKPILFAVQEAFKDHVRLETIPKISTRLSWGLESGVPASNHGLVRAASAVGRILIFGQRVFDCQVA